MDNETITYRPARPALNPGLDNQWEANHYLVYHGGALAFAYDATYYPSTRLVLDHMLATVRGWFAGSKTEPGIEVATYDFVIWREDRIMAAVHYAYNDPTRLAMVHTFDERDVKGEGNDKGAEHVRMGWPTRDQWLADGADEIILRPYEVIRDGEVVTIQPGESLWDSTPVVGLNYGTADAN